MRTSVGLAVAISLGLACGSPPPPPPLRASAPAPAVAQVIGACASAKQVVANLGVDLDVEIFASRSVPATADFAKRIEAELDPYRAAAGGRLHVAVADADDPATLARAKQAGLGPIRVDDKPAYLGVVFTYGKTRQTIEAIDPKAPENVGLSIYLRLRTVRDRAELVTHRIGVLTGHGEPALDEPLVPPSVGRQTIASSVAEGLPMFRLVDVDLQKKPTIDPALEGLIVLQPERDLSPEELRAIDQFVMRGRSLVVAATSPRLAALLRGYGLGLGAESKSDITLLSGGELQTRSLPLWRTHGLALPFASSLAITNDAQPDAMVRTLASKGASHVIASVEGAMSSAFGKERSAGPARVLAIASPAVFRNPYVMAPNGLDYVREGHVNEALFFFRNTLFWMVTDPALLACSWTVQP